VEKRHFPRNESEINAAFPDMREAAEEQSATTEKQHDINKKIREEMRSHAIGARDGQGDSGSGGKEDQKNTLHTKGP
jgi:hypothetical protein